MVQKISGNSVNNQLNIVDATLSGSLGVTGNSTLGNLDFSGTGKKISGGYFFAEKSPQSAIVASGGLTLDLKTATIFNYTSNAGGNWTTNLRGDGSTTLNSMLSIDETITVTHLVPQGATAYYNTSLQVDGTTSGITTKWLGGVPTGGDASSINVYSYSVIKTGNAVFTVLASKAVYS